MTNSLRNAADERTGTATLTESNRHRLLADERRRAVLDVLQDRSTPIDLDELAADVATREDGTDASTEAAVERVAIDLHHKHLPMMADLGVIEYEPGARLIE